MSTVSLGHGDRKERRETSMSMAALDLLIAPVRIALTWLNSLPMQESGSASLQLLTGMHAVRHSM